LCSIVQTRVRNKNRATKTTETLKKRHERLHTKTVITYDKVRSIVVCRSLCGVMAYVACSR
jgi:hypothetical protein